MTQALRATFLLLAATALASCGGGGGGTGTGGGFEPPQRIAVFIAADSLRLNANPFGVVGTTNTPFATEVRATVNNSAGGPIANGTVVTFTVTPSGRGQMSTVDNLSAIASSVTVTTTAGVARAVLHSQTNTGAVTVQASVTDPGSGVPVNASLSVTIDPAPDVGDQVGFDLEASSVAANSNELPPFLGSPHIASVTASAVDLLGTVLPDGTQMNFTVTPASRGQLSDPDDIAVLSSTLTVSSIGGQGTVLFNAGTNTGPATIRVSFLDPVLNDTVTASAVIQVTTGPGPNNQVTVDLQPSSMPANTNNIPPVTGSDHVGSIVVSLRDALGNVIADGTDVSLTVSPTTLGKLSTIEDPTDMVNTLTVDSAGGLASALFHAGSQTGTVTITASFLDTLTNQTATGSSTIQITPGPDPFEQVEFFLESTTVPANTNQVAPFDGSPFISSVTVSLRDVLGDVIADETNVSFQVSPASRALLSSTDDLNERADSITVTSIGGDAQALVHSLQTTGTIQIRASFVDPLTNEQVTASAQMSVVAGPDPFDQVTFDIDDSTIPANTNDVPASIASPFLTSVVVDFRNLLGNAIPDGTEVNVQVSPASLGGLSTPEDLLTQTSTLTLLSSGSKVEAVFHTRVASGTATVSASFIDPVGGQTVTGSSTITVLDGPDPLERLTIRALRTTLPANTFGVPIFLGSPYLTEAQITFIDNEGTLIHPLGDSVEVTVNPVTFGAFSTLDDPATTDVNEIEVLIGQGPVNVISGIATIFLHAFDQTGEYTVTVAAQDPVTNETFNATLDIEVVDIASDGLPADIVVAEENVPIYVQGAGGNESKRFDLEVYDGGGDVVPDPFSDIGGREEVWNNVRVEVISEVPGNGEFLTSTDASGEPVQGETIDIATLNGVSSFVLHSGQEDNLVRINITADRADNNVTNGIQEPLVSSNIVVISDGVPFAIEITSPNINAIFINAVTDGIVGDPGLIPPSLDGTYSLTFSAIVTDRGGNPPIVGTEVEFGGFDEFLEGFPATGPGNFVHGGNDGNPEESGFTFRAPASGRHNVNPALGPGDTLALFGEDSPGDEDHESVRTIDQVNDATRLTVTSPFNPNDQSGSSVNNGPTIPWAAGHASDFTVSNESGSSVTATTNEIGVASTTMNYPVNQLGKLAVIYAQTLGGSLSATKGTFLRTVADVELALFAGVAPATLTVSPNSIPANTTVNVTLCLVDATESPIQGQLIGFGFDAPPGPADVDGVQNAGLVGSPTGTNGCTVAAVTTSGVPPESDDFNLSFFVGDATANVVINSGQEGILQVLPTAVLGNTSGREFVITLLSSSGQPISDVQIQVVCMATNGFINVEDQPGSTDDNGQTTARIAAQVDGGPNNTPVGEGECTFSTSSGSPSADVVFIGLDLCLLGGSPPILGCEDPVDMTTLIVQNLVTPLAPGCNPGAPLQSCPVTISSTPSGVNCGATCQVDFETGGAVQLFSTYFDGTNDVLTPVTFNCGGAASIASLINIPLIGDQIACTVSD